jgi:hypothetical protein
MGKEDETFLVEHFMAKVNMFPFVLGDLIF